MGDVVLGEDWVTPDSAANGEIVAPRQRRGLFALRSSPLTRKIITFNLIALNILVAGILYLNSTRDSLAIQRISSLVSEAELISDVIEAQLPSGAPINLATGYGVDVDLTLNNLDLRNGIEVFVFDRRPVLVATRVGEQTAQQVADAAGGSKTLLTDGLNWLWERISAPFAGTGAVPVPVSMADRLKTLVPAALAGETQVRDVVDAAGNTFFQVLTPVMNGQTPVGVVAVTSANGEIDKLVRGERERVLQMFVIATLVSVGLSLVLASTIANPLADLAAAAELGRDRNTRKMNNPGRIRIPDLTARPDEIGRLSGALRGMISALYNRIDGNEQFAADVAHEIKNPLASLRSAVGTMRVVKRDEQRGKLLDVIEHDVRRMDRLVSDIANASRLDAELVKEDEEPFDLLKMIENLSRYLGEEADNKGVEFIIDLPNEHISITGLEARLAQVFVNLITNATSFCGEGDAIRVWVRKRQNRVLIVVEDTGPGIPEEAITKIFKRFYSERPQEHFGNNSGLGLAISKQIVEAHGGVIWAENIRPTDADAGSEPLGARFVVGLPV
ncbi:MAG: sensor histidine kinase [Pseudomonadota bacterium]